MPIVAMLVIAAGISQSDPAFYASIVLILIVALVSTRRDSVKKKNP